jgi:hypothetical protein
MSGNDLAGTTWNYKDNDSDFKITFDAKEKLHSTNKNDVTTENDTWRQEGSKVYFDFNDKYSSYEGQLFGQDSITGKGHNTRLAGILQCIK